MSKLCEPLLHLYEYDPDRVEVVDRDPRYGYCSRKGWLVCKHCGDVQARGEVPASVLQSFLDFLEAHPEYRIVFNEREVSHVWVDGKPIE